MSDENELTPEDTIETADRAHASAGTSGANAEGAIPRDPGASGTALVSGSAIRTTTSPEEMRAAQIGTFKKVSPIIVVIAVVAVIALAVHRSSGPPAFDATDQSTWACAGVDAATTDPAYSDVQVNVYDFTTWYAANCY
jgi:hypothetical protein